MKLKVAKSSVMCFGSKVSVTEQIPVVYVGDVPLKPVSTQKYLGVVFDNQLRWDSHVSTVKRSLIIYIGLMPITSTCLMMLKLLIDSLVLSCLTYALPVWGPAISKQYLTRLQCQHNWAVRIVRNLIMSLPIALNLGGYLWTLLFAIVLCVPCIDFIIGHLLY